MEDVKAYAFAESSVGRECGYGYGSGDGDGDGYGSNVGYGSGYGSGDGYGSNVGFGVNNDFLAFDGNHVFAIDDIPTVLNHVHGNFAKGSILCNDMTLAPCYIAKSGATFAHGETLRDAMTALSAKLMKNMPEDERIKRFVSEVDASIDYPAKVFFDWHHWLTGSCEMGRREFAKSHAIDIDHDRMTVSEFLTLTKNAYGGRIIRRVMDEMEMQK